MVKKISSVLSPVLDTAIAEGLNKCLEHPELGALHSCIDGYLNAAQAQLKATLACNTANPAMVGLWYESADVISQQRAQVEQSVDEAEAFYHCISPETSRALKMSAALCDEDGVYGDIQAALCEDITRDAQTVAQTCEPLTETFNTSVSRLAQLVEAHQWCVFGSTPQTQVMASKQEVREEFQMLSDTLCYFAPTMGESRLNEWLLGQGLSASDAQGLGFLILGSASGFSGKVPYGASRITSPQDCGGYVATCEFPYALEDNDASPEMAAN